MQTTLLGTGLACMIAAVVGGGLKAAGMEMPAIGSIKRQFLLFVLGSLLLVGSIRMGNATSTASGGPSANSGGPATNSGGQSANSGGRSTPSGKDIRRRK